MTPPSTPHPDPRPPRPSLEHIRGWVGDAALRRGRAYLKAGRLLAPRYRSPDTLLALCRGNAPEPYRVRAVITDEGIAEARCTCPMGTGGHCKHVAALLLAWREQPATFAPQPTLREILEKADRETLLRLLETLTENNPDLVEHILAWREAQR